MRLATAQALREWEALSIHEAPTLSTSIGRTRSLARQLCGRSAKLAEFPPGLTLVGGLLPCYPYSKTCRNVTGSPARWI